MKMTPDKLAELVSRYQSGLCSPAEMAFLESWYNKRDVNAISELSPEEFLADLSIIRSGLVLQDQPSHFFKVKRISLAVKIALAASVLLILSFSSYLIYTSLNTQEPQNLFVNDIPPGINQATITLANGKTIPLSQQQKTLVIASSGLSYNDGTAVAGATAEGIGTSIQMLRASIPLGGTYQLTLPDGTKVWLNAGSSLKFPSNFNGAKERKVELTGEAYFEVFSNARQPFEVKTATQELSVLGTHFNVNAYDNETVVRTTLAEGVVLIRKKGIEDPVEGRDFVVLKPGQQSQMALDALAVKAVDVMQYISWKDGFFRFEDNTIEEVMKMLSRWYNIKVVYRNTPGTSRYTGNISKSVHISEILNMLKRTNSVGFEVQGRRVTVMN